MSQPNPTDARRDRQPWTVAVRDPFDRPGAITITVRDGVAILTSPPGEAAKLTGAELSALIAALNEARYELRRTES